MNCKCKAHVSYHAEGNTITAKLDKIDFCPLHGAAEKMKAALKMFGTVPANSDVVRTINDDDLPCYDFCRLHHLANHSPHCRNIRAVLAALEASK